MRTQVMLIASVAAGGCSFSSSAKPTDAHGIDTRSPDGPPDSAIDAPPDGPQMDFGPTPYTVHLSALPPGGVTLPAAIDTDSAAMCSTLASWVSASQPAACFIVGTTIMSSGGTLVATGSKPLVLVATSTITLAKGIDVSSKRAGTTRGAGGNYTLCDAFVANPANDANGGGGGAGGTFMTQGGVGASGNTNGAAGGTPPNAGSTSAILRGGCGGQKGGNSGGTAGNAGNGGGAVYVLAATSISLTIGINASGGGAMHGGHATGGSGGGSGGMIVLYAPTITATGATFIANGGGASSGGDNNSNGNDGSDPTMAATAAPGGNGPGGNGGNGAILTTSGGGGAGGGGMQGGGGGGGGVGYIRSNVMLAGAIASPAVDVVP